MEFLVGFLIIFSIFQFFQIGNLYTKIKQLKGKLYAVQDRIIELEIWKNHNEIQNTSNNTTTISQNDTAQSPPPPPEYAGIINAQNNIAENRPETPVEFDNAPAANKLESVQEFKSKSCQQISQKYLNEKQNIPLVRPTDHSKATVENKNTIDNRGLNKSETQSKPAQSIELESEIASPNLLEKGISYAKNWITTGNIPVKIGMLVLFFSVIALLKYASNQGWLRIPVEYRLIGIAAGAITALFFAWKKRETKRSFSLSVQGGSIGILLIDIFAAVKLYPILSSQIGFILSLAAVITASVLAIKQNSKSLIIMAIFAGFLAPIWLSDETGSHITLFTYYAILNAGIFIVSWKKNWRELNLLGFIFTYVIGSVWGGLQYAAENFISTEPFVILFFIFYVVIPLRLQQKIIHSQQHDYTNEDINENNLKSDGENYQNILKQQSPLISDSKISASLLFGTPLVTLGLHAGMLYNNSMWLAITCVTMGIFYGILALSLKEKAGFTIFQKAYTGLCAGFLTLAVPIGMSAKVTSAVFALEGAGAIWLGCKEKRTLPWLSGVFLQASSIIGFIIAYAGFNHIYAGSTFILNERFLSSALIIVGLAISVWSCAYNNDDAEDKIHPWINSLSLYHSSMIFFASAFVLWVSTAGYEVWRVTHETYPILIFITITAGLLSLIYRRYSNTLVIALMTLMMLVSFIALPIFIVTITGTNITDWYPLAEWGYAFWLIYTVLGWFIWQSIRNTDNVFVDFGNITWLISIATFITSLIIDKLPLANTDQGMYWWGVSGVWLALGYASINTKYLSYVMPRLNASMLAKIKSIIMAVLVVIGTIILIMSGGNPIIWIPIINPLELLLIIIACPTIMWLSERNHIIMKATSYVITAALVLSITFRMIYQWGGFSSHWNDWLSLITFGLWVAIFVCINHVLPQKFDVIHERFYSLFVNLKNTIMVLLSAAWLILLTSSGKTGFIPWLPILNPLMLLQCTIIITLWNKLKNSQYINIILAVLALTLISLESLRFVHHFGDITWSLNMFKYAISQMTLTIIWSILGVIAWLFGSTRNSHSLWKVGAILMTVVLIKLVLIDRSHLGNVYGILSFFAYGLLCVITGYFAPMPPKNDKLSFTKD